MRLWLSKNSGVPIREQLTRQIILAIISGDLAAGDKLPSIRELGRRYKIHPNTAAAAYHWLEENGWTQARTGSGVYVQPVSRNRIDETVRGIQHDLDKSIFEFLRDAEQRGFDKQQIKSRVNYWLNDRRPRQIIILEDDADLAAILRVEIGEKFSLPITINGNEEEFAKGSLVVAISELPSTPLCNAFVKLRLNSVQDSMSGRPRPAATDLIGVASHWEQFRKWSQTMLAAVGIAEENLVVRDTRDSDWKKGLSSCSLIIADSLTAKQCGNLENVVIFRLISEESLEGIRRFIK